ncbi:MAG: hypothetical protein JWO51_2368 [Rhodospirillales bacterium]|nr:hypothetical protein [Rhodospirillales bacterium]
MAGTALLLHRQAAFTLVATLLLGGLVPAPCRAQSDDAPDETPSVTVPARPAPDSSVHRHGGGGDDDAVRSSFRDDRGPNSGMRIESTPGTGLALDHSPLPGELGATPEESAPLFEKRTGGLAMRPDPWVQSPK